MSGFSNKSNFSGEGGITFAPWTARSGDPW